MSPIKRFQPEDIGVELFPAITSGLYKDPLDALREYIQNAIDAKATRVEITLTKDVISVKDNGSGMTPKQAEQAIRLGISEKNPVDHVGFRGIGIYSSFELCDRLEIHTRADTAQPPSLISVDFRAIRAMLAEEGERRKQRKEPELHLERMLSQAVTVEEDRQPPLDEVGTLVLMVGVRGTVFRRLNNTDQVTTYLQGVVPLPFDPRFKFGKKINSRFKKEDYRVVDVILGVGGRQMPVFRPYANDVFTHGGKYPPQFFEVVSPNTQRRYGFAWVCINDARRVLTNTELRGLLVKKYGFSVSNRAYLEPFFPRTVFSRRITGEVIVQHRDLIPNAARTDFETNEARADFQVALTDLVQAISKWANEIQEKLKALEELDEIAPRVFEIHHELPAARRDVDQLLRFNIELSELGQRLKTHARILEAERQAAYRRTAGTLTEAQETLREMLAQQPKRPAKKYIERAVRRQRGAPAEEETVHREDRPRTLIEVLESLDVVITEPIRLAITYLDEGLLRPNLSDDQYAGELEALRDYLEEHV